MPDRVLVSAIFGNITGREWEIKLYPGSHSGITKESVVRLDNTIWINASFVIKTLGSLNTAEFNVIKDAMIKYSDFYRANSPEDFGDNTLDIFHIQISEN
ncbi:hypothetical protein AGMMS50276_20880 [Synergistales bacterium]|nr:hypothetical protein AGMMS50276_20880 [Synergistales bacterium]